MNRLGDPSIGILQSIALAVVVFATTNADDLVLLAAFFSDERLKPRAIVIGQFVGIGTLTAISLAAAFGAARLPATWVALVGVVPLLLGIWKLAAAIRGRTGDDEASPVETSGASQVLAVAGVTIANGGDNLGVYIPLFAARPSTAIVCVIVFAVLTAVWCVFGWWLVRNRLIGRHVARFGRVALPFVLIAVGLHVLSGALPLLRRPL